jgi:hypothetical protein
MAATFPGGVKPFTTKRNGPDGDVVDASHINDLQDEVVAIETELLKTAGSVIDHGSLSGLGDNDHPQYSKTDHVHTEYAGTNHNHDATYLGIAATAKDSDKLGGELPSAFSRTNHAHTGYAASDHNHDTTYAPKTHTHTEYVKNTGNETISGVKTFSSLPVLPTTAPTANNPIRKGYADSNYVGITGNQTVSGEKTFSTLPKVPTTTPTSNDQVASKAYVDSVASGGSGGSGGPYVDLTTNQSIGGVKTFTSIPLLPSSMPTLNNQAANKAYVDSVAGGGGSIIVGTHLRSTVDQDIANNAFPKLLWDTEDYDTMNGWAPGQAYVTVPSDGLYFIAAYFLFSGITYEDNKVLVGAIVINDESPARISSVIAKSTSGCHANISSALPLVANDQISINIYASNYVSTRMVLNTTVPARLSVVKLV